MFSRLIAGPRARVERRINHKKSIQQWKYWDFPATTPGTSPGEDSLLPFVAFIFRQGDRLVSASGYYTRLAAAAFVAAGLGFVISHPDLGRRTAERVVEARAERLEAEDRACAPGEAPLTGGFANIDDVLSLSPLGPARPPEAAPAAPFIRVLPKPGRGSLQALSPGKVDVVAIERRDGDGGPVWTVRFKPCDRIVVVYDGLDAIDAQLLRRASLASNFVATGKGRETLLSRIRLTEGDAVGRGAGFNVALVDSSAPAVRRAAPASGRDFPVGVDADGSQSPALARALEFDEERARCPLEYMQDEAKALWTVKVGDWRGMRFATGETACERAPPRVGVAAFGPWYTDSSHNARAEKVRAIALADDPINPDRLVFALDGVLPSLTASFIANDDMSDAERRALAHGALTFDPRDGRINAPFSEVRENETYCYEDVRAGFSGPSVAGVILLEIVKSDDAPALLRIEARGDALKCLDLPEPWTFTGNQTTFFRRG